MTARGPRNNILTVVGALKCSLLQEYFTVMHIDSMSQQHLQAWNECTTLLNGIPWAQFEYAISVAIDKSFTLCEIVLLL